MPIRLDIPFLPQAGYTAFLAANRAWIHSLYFSLFATPAVDARFPLGPWREEDLHHHLPVVQGIPKYVLLNSRFYHPDHYFDGEFLGALAARLEALTSAGLADGVIFTDFYLLQALGRHRPGMAPDLEAVPSVNVQIDTPRQLHVCMDMVRAAGFRLPRKLILDRSLNRRPRALAKMAAIVRERYPGTALGLLANEGCLPSCPFKPAHDAHIALGNLQLAPERTYAMNAELGCLQLFRRQPERIFQSPFIRPEDVDRYAGLIAFVKLSGRTLGAAFLQNALRAYRDRRYDGNLLDLMDTLEALAGEIHVAGPLLPEDFLERMWACPDDCRACRYCRDLARGAVRRRPLGLADLRRHGAPTSMPQTRAAAQGPHQRTSP